MTDDKEDRFETRLRDALREQADAIDGPTRSRLNRARQQVLAELDHAGHRPAGLGSGWQPALGAAALAALAIALWPGRGGPLSPVAPSIDGADPALELELLLAEDSLEMLEELEFYKWLDSQPQLQGGPERAG
ncbi:MAG: hypothetical protein FJ197_01070 [Gammaproteobacteria bacterium]|nr:hypothetical protein [Gammaproteobacteria bacterium]